MMTGPQDDRELISSGYQGVIYKVSADSLPPGGFEPGPNFPKSGYLIVKEAMGFALLRKLRQVMIRREFEIYQRLVGLPGIPKCYGLKDNRLLLEFIDGHSLRLSKSELPDREDFFAGLLDIILSVHRAGVAHADLKRKDNILVTHDGQPRLIDFGTAVVKKETGIWGDRLYRQACQIDLNAWVKHKYLGRYDLVSEDDAPYFELTTVEKWTAPVRKAWRKITARHWREHRRPVPEEPESHR
jgi:serine/threonine protein kinase